MQLIFYALRSGQERLFKRVSLGLKRSLLLLFFFKLKQFKDEKDDRTHQMLICTLFTSYTCKLRRGNSVESLSTVS